MIYESLADWKKEAEKRFGKDEYEWAFVCPACGNVAKEKILSASRVREQPLIQQLKPVLGDGPAAEMGTINVTGLRLDCLEVHRL